MSGEVTMALVLRAQPLGETDVLVSLITRERGAVRAVARGGRASHKRFGGALAPFARIEVSLERGRGQLARLAEAHLVEAHLGLARDLARYEAAARLVRLLLRLSADEHKESALFDAAVQAVALLADPGRVSVRAAELWARLTLLRACGLEVSAGQCAGCATPVPRGRQVYFHPVRGGVMCTPCGGGPVLLSSFAAMALIDSSHGPVEQANVADIEALHSCLDAFEQWHVVRFARDAVA